MGGLVRELGGEAGAGSPAGGEVETGATPVVRQMRAEERPSTGRGGSGSGGPKDGVAAAPAVDRTMVAAAVKRRTGLGIERIGDYD